MEKRRQARPRRRAKASTSDVLAPRLDSNRVRPKWRPFYKRLVELRDVLLNRRQDETRSGIDEPPTFSTHMADAGTDTYNRDLALGVLSSEQDALFEIEEALNRIRDGTYGTCELTGKPIEPARLEAIPWTRFSAAAEKQLEQQGVLKHTRLGPRESVARTEATEPE